MFALQSYLCSVVLAVPTAYVLVRVPFTFSTVRATEQCSDA